MSHSVSFQGGEAQGAALTGSGAAPAQSGSRAATSWNVGRLLRIGLGALILGVALLFLWDRFFTFSSTRAVLSAAPFALRAPVEGILQAEPRLPGSLLERGARFGQIQNERIDDGRLTELGAGVRVLEAEIAAIERRLRGTAARAGAAGEAAGAFRQTRLEQIAARRAEAEAQLSAAAARLRAAEAGLARGEALRRGGYIAAAALDALRRERDVASGEQRAAAQRRAALLAEQAGAEGGVFAAEAGTDRSASQQSQDRLQLAELELEASLAERHARLAAMRGRLEHEAARITRLREATLMVPAEARLVSLAAQPGEYVRQGQEIAGFVDCTRPLVRAEMDERGFRALRLGMRARFVMAGEREEHEGRVVQLLPPMLAGPEGRETFLAVVQVASDRLSRGCEVGRIGSVRFG